MFIFTGVNPIHILTIKKNNNSKKRLAYVSFYSMPKVTDKSFKLERFAFAFDFLFLLEKTFDITVFDFIGINATFIKKGVRFTYLKRKHNNPFVFPLRLFLKLKKLNPDVVYVQGLSYPHFIIVMRYFLKPTCKITVHDHANKLPKGIKEIVFKKADKQVNSYFFTSKSLAKRYIETGLIASEKKIVECVEGSTNFNYNPSIKKDKNQFLWVGRLDKNKDPITVLKGFALFAKKKSKVSLTLFFENTELLPEVREFIKTNNIENQVKLKGKSPHKELEKWYQKSGFFLLGSHKEGGPIALIEAMACGCIPIVTSIPVFKTMTNEGTCGFHFNPGNYIELFKILTALDDIDFENYQKNVVRFFNANLSHQAIANTLKKAFLKED